MQLKDFAYYGSYDFFTKKLSDLSLTMAPEKWSFGAQSDFSILRNYIFFTFSKLYDEHEEQKIEEEKQKVIYTDENLACFNTGLFDSNWQQIYFFCTKNKNVGYQPWFFKGFCTPYSAHFWGLADTIIRPLKRANYFSDPSALIYDASLDIVPQWDHILEDQENYERIPETIRSNGVDFCHNVIRGAIENVKMRIQANYKTAVPQYYNGKIQLLVPLYLTNPKEPDLALVLSKADNNSVYYGHTCLTIPMAYNNARLIAKPESYWLHT